MTLLFCLGLVIFVIAFFVAQRDARLTKSINADTITYTVDVEEQLFKNMKADHTEDHTEDDKAFISLVHDIMESDNEVNN